MNSADSQDEFDSLQSDLLSLSERLRLSLKAARMIEFDYDLDHDQKKENPIEIKQLGVAPKNRKEGLAVIHPDDREKFSDSLESAYLHGAAVDCEYRVRYIDGQYRWTRSIGRVVGRNPHRRGHLLGVTMDITQRKELELALAGSTRWQQLAIEAAPINVTEMDIKTGIRSIGPRDQEWFGFEPSTLEQWYQSLHPDDREHTKKSFDDLITSGQSVEAEYRIVHLNGTQRWVRTHARPMFDDDGNTVGISGVAIDVSHEHEQAEKLENALKQAQAASAAKSAFLASMSHEIRTPLNAVLGCADLLVGSGLNATQQQLAMTLRNSSRMLLDIINNVLDFSKIEAGALEIEQREFDPLQCLESAADVVAADAATKQLMFDMLCRSKTIPIVIGDAGRIRQILVNLLGNAVKFTVSGAVGADIRWDATDEQSGVLTYRVIDTGPGIPENIQSRLFEPFRQGDASTTRRYGGTGLGLAICRRLVEAMGGTIELESRASAGAAFVVKVPMQVANGSLVLDEKQLPVGMHLNVAHRQTRAWLATQAEIWRLDYLDLSIPSSKRNSWPVIIDQSALELKPNSAALKKANALLRLRDSHSSHLIEGPMYILTWPFRPSELFRALTTENQQTASVKSISNEIEKSFANDHPLQILIVEDNLVNQTVIDAMLRALGYEADIVDSGFAAIDALQRESYDVVLMDIEMPGMDGLAASRAIREVFQNDTSPWIVAVTAHVLSDTRDKIDDAGMNDYLGKPLLLTDLRSALERASSALGISS